MPSTSPGPRVIRVSARTNSQPGSLEGPRAEPAGGLRWLRPLGLVILAVVLVDAATERPAPGLHGAGLGVLLALVAFAVGLLGAREARVRGAPAWTQVACFAALLGGCGVLIWLQPSGPGFLGIFFLAASLVTLRTPVGVWSAVGGLALVVALALLRAVTTHRSVGGILLSVLSLSVVYLVVVLAQRARDGQRRAERLLEELERTRAAQVRAAALAERQHLAREMHDVLAHSLSGLTLQLEGARLLATAEQPDTGRIAAAIERAHHLAKAGLEDARRAIGALRDEELPGPQRLAALAREFERDSGVPCHLEVGGEERELGSQARLALYRTAQEALTNVRKHAHAERVELRLDYQPLGTRLVVEDFAAGGDRPPAPASDRPAAPTGDGYGLTGMRERAELLGGTLTAAPTGTGFRVELWVPA
jgi:signal transduction histidine kinase